MSLYSNLNGNLGKAPEQAAAVDMEKNRVNGPNDDLLVDPTDLGKSSKKPVLLSVIAVGVVAFLIFNIIMKMTANDSLEVFSITATSNGATIELYENQMKVNAYENGEWIYEEGPSVTENLSEVVEQLPVVTWDDSFELRVPDGTKLKWFDLYDENLTCIRRFAEDGEVSEFLADEEADTYYVIAGASWEGKYVLKSFTNESFTSEFCVTLVKE